MTWRASLVAETGGKACNAGDLVQSLGWEDLLGKGMAALSSVLAGRIPWIEELGRLLSVAQQRVGQH